MNFILGASKVSPIPIVILTIYIAMMIGVAIFSYKKSRSLNDFFLAGKGLGGWMSAFAYGTTYFSSVIFVGYAGKFGWTMGIGAVWIGIGNALIGALLAWAILAKRTRAITHGMGARTMPEYFEKRYGSRGLKMLSALIIFSFLIPYSASVYQGLGYLFESVFKIDMVWCVLIMSALTALYLFFGGYFATALSDFVQGIIMIVGVVVMVVLVMSAPEVNIEGIKGLFDSGRGIIPTAQGGWDSPLFNLIILTLLTSFGVWGLPQSVHKFYAIKSKKSIKQAMVVSTVFCLVIGVGAYLTGAMGSLFMSSVPGGNYDMIIPTMLEKALPSAMLGLIVVLVLSASMSTLASLSLSGASSFAVDAYKGFIKPSAKDKEVTWVLRGSCMLFIIISVVLALVQIDAIVTLMSLSWGVLAGCFIGPYVLGLYCKKVNKHGAYASMISGLVLTFILIIVFGIISPAKNVNGVLGVIKGGVARSPLIGVICMAVSMIVTYTVSIATAKKYPNKFDLNAIVAEEYAKLDEEEVEEKAATKLRKAKRKGEELTVCDIVQDSEGDSAEELTDLANSEFDGEMEQLPRQNKDAT